ncbi:hypothetical protein [Dyadobacter sandarakinus]
MIWLRIGNASTIRIAEILLHRFEAIQAFADDENLFLFEILRP